MTEFLLQAAAETWNPSGGLRLPAVRLCPRRRASPSSCRTALLKLFLGRGKIRSVLWASAIGAPLPLCSCGVVPAALGLSRQGATQGATVAFLIATPETGVDSIAPELRADGSDHDRVPARRGVRDRRDGRHRHELPRRQAPARGRRRPPPTAPSRPEQSEAPAPSAEISIRRSRATAGAASRAGAPPCGRSSPMASATCSTRPRTGSCSA